MRNRKTVTLLATRITIKAITGKGSSNSLGYPVCFRHALNTHRNREAAARG